MLYLFLFLNFFVNRKSWKITRKSFPKLKNIFGRIAIKSSYFLGRMRYILSFFFIQNSLYLCKYWGLMINCVLYSMSMLKLLLINVFQDDHFQLNATFFFLYQILIRHYCSIKKVEAIAEVADAGIVEVIARVLILAVGVEEKLICLMLTIHLSLNIEVNKIL